jgi:hypothetical protein
MTLLWRVLAMMIFCSGCLDSGPSRRSGSDRPGPTPPAGDEAASAAQPESAMLTKAEAAERYLESVRPYNAALDEFEAAARTDRPWTELRVLAGRVAAANAAQVRILRATTWPQEVRGEVTALTAASVRAGRYWSTAAGADEPQRFRAAVLRAAGLSGKPEATALRHALGLPPRPRG